MISRKVLPWLATAAVLLVGAPAAVAQQPDTTRRAPSRGDIEALVAHLDSGSQAFADGRLQEARRHHLVAVELAPELTSAWFGLFMVEDSLGNDEAADSALAQVRRISPGAIPPELQDRLPEPRE